MSYRVSLVGAGAGALLGGISRAVLAALHLSDTSRQAIPVVLTAVVIGIVIGALAGATGRPLLGATVGAVLSTVVFVGVLPLVGLLHLLGAGTIPSLLEVVAAGAIPGGIGGAVGQMSVRRRSSAGGRGTQEGS